MAILLTKLKRACAVCSHLHREGVYCHFYTEAADGESAEDYFSETESESEDEESLESANYYDSDESLSVAPVVVESRPSKILKMRPLSTPSYVNSIGYIRCNCSVGMPTESKRYETIPPIVVVGEIQIQTYHEIMDSRDRARYNAALKARFPEELTEQRELQRAADIGQNVARIMSYLPLGMCSAAPQVSTHWNYGASLYTDYIDMRNCIPWKVEF